MNFPQYKNSLLLNTLKRKLEDELNDEDREKSKIDPSINTNLSMISGLYLYTGTPPHGYGTQAPKVAETIIRAYGYNKKRKNKTITLLGREIERLHWEKEDGPFPFNETHGNFIPSETRVMVEKFLKKNQPHIDSTVEKIMKFAMNHNADVLTKGRQTFCPFTGQSVTSAVAYKRMYDFLTENSGNKCMSCLEWIQAYFQLMNKKEVEYTTYDWKTEDRKIFNKETKQRITVKKKVKRRVLHKTESVEETRNLMIQMSTRFASYIKHKERGKKDRRAIASANMILRMFLYIIEEFHLELAKHVEGATISIGGEEKKRKIASNMSIASLPTGPARVICQGTEDATKWNECLSPSLFALMHYYMFDKTTRTKLGLPASTEMGKLFAKIAISGNFLMSMKEIQLGQGVLITNENEYSRLEWSREWIESMNEETKGWFTEIEDKIDPSGEFVKASPGMMMGTLNAGSTHVGLLASNHRMNPLSMKVMSLRSSDDSMSLYMADSAENEKACVQIHKKNLGMIGINLSDSKSLFFRFLLGEYTSWFMDGKFVAQFGTETSSIRPKGTNPQDDFYSIAKETATSLSTLSINHMGAAVRLRLGIDGTKRLWRINKELGKRKEISENVQLLADGGSQPWNCCNCHLEETSLREFKAVTDEEKKYLLRIRNPENPFSSDPFEETVFSKEHGKLILETTEIPRTCFHYLKKSNRTLNREDKKEEAELETANNEATKIVNFIDPTTLVSYPTSSSSIAQHLQAVISIEKNSHDLDKDETALFDRAMGVLGGNANDLLGEDDNMEFGGNFFTEEDEEDRFEW